VIGALMTYGALTTKAKALYGKRLRLADFEHMSALKTVSDLLEYLRTQPGWSKAVSSLSGGYIGRVELEAALRDQIRAEYASLLHFAPREDRALLSFPARLTEQNLLLTALRRLRSGGYYKGSPLPSSVSLHLQVDEKALAGCRDYEGLVAAAAGSIYESILRYLTPNDGGLPDFTTAEALLRATYFAHMYRLVHKNYSGETKQVLLRSLGEQVDLLNVIHILRLKSYFPDADNDLYLTVLFPFNYRLRPAFLQQLCAAPDAQAAFALLKDSPYADCFTDVAVAEVEDYYRRAFYSFNRRQLSAASPSIYTAVAYLNVKDSEMRCLINVVESVKYGVPYDAEFAKLVGA